MNKIINSISKNYPCRENLIQQLCSLVGEVDEQSCGAIYLYGQSGIGKSVILQEVLQFSDVDNFVIINCLECYSPEILYETILTELNGSILQAKNNFRTEFKCKNMMNFLRLLEKLIPSRKYVIVLENAEELRDMEYNLLPCFLKLQSLTRLNICTILVANIPFEKYHSKVGTFDAVVVYAPAYTKNEMVQVLMTDFENVRRMMRHKAQRKDEIEILDSLDAGFYENYINIMLTVFYRVTRDVNELKNTARFCFEKYVEPVLDGTIEHTQSTRLWKHVSPVFLNVLRRVEIGMYDEKSLTPSNTLDSQISSVLTQLELPFYTKYLLIAAFLASNNNAKDDKRLFMKNSGKTKKKSQKTQAKVTEKMITQLGPQSFSIDRLLAIFYAILEEKVDLNAKLLAQISNLAHLRLLRYVSGETNVMDGSVRMQCTVGLEFILHVGKSVGFNVRQYLCDFI